MPLRRERNGIFYADEYIVDPKSKRRRRIRLSSRTKDAQKAKRWYAALIEEIWRVQQLGDGARYGWKEAVVNYMKGREEAPSYKQDRQRAKWLDQFLADFSDLRDLSTAFFDLDLKPVLIDGREPSTANRYLTFVKAVLNHARRMDRLDRIPTITMFPVPERKPVFLEQHEIDALVRQLDSSPRTRHLVDFVILACDTGLRMLNITHLKWSDIDLEQQSMWINKSSTKGNRHLALPLSDAAFAVIKRCEGAHPRYVLTYRGKPYDNVNPRTLKKAAAAAGIKKPITAHVFRHTFATKLFHKGYSLFEVMALGGWSKAESVQIYTHFNQERLRQTVQDGSSFGAKPPENG
jgi:integrase